MTEEKLLAFLNLKKDKKIDKTVLNIALGFDIGFTCVIILYVLLLHHIEFTLINVFIILMIIIVDIVLFILIKKAINPVSEIIHPIKIFILSEIKLLYGYVICSKDEFMKYGYPRITWIHISLLIACIFLAMYMMFKMIRVYKYLQKYTIEKSIEKTQKENKFPIWAALIATISPMFLVRLSRGVLNKIGLGIGFALWGLACIWLFFILISLPKYVIAKKYGIDKSFVK